MWPLFWTNLISMFLGTGLRVPSGNSFDWFGLGLWLVLTTLILIGCCITEDGRAQGAAAVAAQVAIWCVAPLIGQPSRVSDITCGFLVCLFAGIAAVSAKKCDRAKEHPALLFVIATPVLGLVVGSAIGLWHFICWTLGLRVTHKSRREA